MRASLVLWKLILYSQRGLLWSGDDLYEATQLAEDRGQWRRIVHNVGCQHTTNQLLSSMH